MLLAVGTTSLAEIECKDSKCSYDWDPCSVLMLMACTGDVSVLDTHAGSMSVHGPRLGSVHVPETHPGSVLVLGVCGGLGEGLGAFEVHVVLVAHRIVQGPQLAAQGALAIGGGLCTKQASTL